MSVRRIPIAATLVVALVGGAGQFARADVTSTVVDLPSRGQTQRILHVRPDAPIANLVALPGSDGVLRIQPDGRFLAGGCFPVNRTQSAIADHRIAIAFVDASTDGSVRNTADLLAVVNYMQSRDNVPVWIIGGSSSTGAVLKMALSLPAEMQVGVIFFSPELLDAAASAQNTRPTLVVFHVDDNLQAGDDVYARMTAAPVKELAMLTGGNPQGCGYHLFNGIETKFSNATVGFIEKVSSTYWLASGSVVPAVEFYHQGLDHYFLTHVAGEIDKLDAGVAIKGWIRTGQSFNVYQPGTAGTSPVCRFYIPPTDGDSHFYGRGTDECVATGAAHPTFVNEDPEFFKMVLPAAGVCPAGTRNVYRTFSNRPDANHRYLVDRTIRDAMTAKNWLAEGDGPDLVVMCSPL